MATAKSPRPRRRSVPKVRKGQAKWPLTREKFTQLFNERLIRRGRREPDDGLRTPRPK